MRCNNLLKPYFKKLKLDNNLLKPCNNFLKQDFVALKQGLIKHKHNSVKMKQGLIFCNVELINFYGSFYIRNALFGAILYSPYFY